MYQICQEFVTQRHCPVTSKYQSHVIDKHTVLSTKMTYYGLGLPTVNSEVAEGCLTIYLVSKLFADSDRY